MSQASLTTEDLKALEQLRRSLFQMRDNISSFRNDLFRSDPLPSPHASPCPASSHLLTIYRSSIQSSATIIGSNIQSVTSLLANNAELLNRCVIFPQPNYPGRQHENLLGQLLRKKLEPQIETKVEEGRAAVPVGDNDPEELWKWASAWIGERAFRFVDEEANEFYTEEERKQGIENVRTGLRVNVMEESSDEDEDEDEDEVMENGGQQKGKTGPAAAKVPADDGISLEDMLKFSITGGS